MCMPARWFRGTVAQNTTSTVGQGQTTSSEPPPQDTSRHRSTPSHACPIAMPHGCTPSSWLFAPVVVQRLFWGGGGPENSSFWICHCELFHRACNVELSCNPDRVPFTKHILHQRVGTGSMRTFEDNFPALNAHCFRFHRWFQHLNGNTLRKIFHDNLW